MAGQICKEILDDNGRIIGFEVVLPETSETKTDVKIKKGKKNGTNSTHN